MNVKEKTSYKTVSIPLPVVEEKDIRRLALERDTKAATLCREWILAGFRQMVQGQPKGGA